jgi:transposase
LRRPVEFALWARGIKPVIARRGVEHGSHLGTHRWVVERGFAHLHNFRRLRTRYERDPEIHEAFLKLACAILCFRRLQSF